MQPMCIAELVRFEWVRRAAVGHPIETDDRAPERCQFASNGTADQAADTAHQRCSPSHSAHLPQCRLAAPASMVTTVPLM